MSHTVRDKKKLLDRTRRIKGQIEGIERSLEEEKDCFAILQNVAACRGALNGLMAEIIDGHIQLHVIDPKRPHTHEQHEAADDLMKIIRTYLR